MTAISFGNALGIHEQALNVRVARAEVLANNLANADTPGFKARDINFRDVLQQLKPAQSAGGQLQMAQTHDKHLSQFGQVRDAAAGIELVYRKPLQTGIDGNTVDAQHESAEFAKNAMDFSASFRLLNGKFGSLSKAIKGE
ncbi:MAG: flagellar basal body rod protein FlgB [Pseudomonadales bacterium]|nr:flagellar basal body rod protein FlgB [Gammaproteobacteria bacterium]NNL56233.1 flagellar basal body rod protein FlgB [Pseudomonadales bacterium]